MAADPAVAAAWLPHIADALADVDPENADTYRANATAGAERLTALRADMAARLAPLAGQGYAVGHDAYQYLEHAAGLPPPLGRKVRIDQLHQLRPRQRAGERVMAREIS